jgi:dTDP-4-amino-4,6-dideoxygalactose transaminase
MQSSPDGLFLPVARPTLGPEEEQAVAEVLASGWVGTGPKVAEFEGMLQQCTGASAVVAVNSCTSALHLALLAAGAGPGTEVITTPWTWVATSHAIEYTGAQPVYVDVNDDFNMNVDLVEDAITDATRVILPVHMAGRPVDLGALHRIARAYALTVVEDAAHALGATYKGHAIGGTDSRFTCLSFQANKNITTGDGGAVCLSEPGDADYVRNLAQCGNTTDAWKRLTAHSLEPPLCVRAGFKSTMTDIAAALGVAQLPKLQRFLARRRELASLYRSHLSTVAEVILPSEALAGADVQHMFIVRLDPRRSIDRDDLRARLHARHIGTGVHYRPLHFQPYYREKYHLRPDDLPTASALADQVLTLPLYPSMTDEQVARVCDALKATLREFAI